MGGLPESRSPWLHRLGGVHGQSAPLRGQRQPLRSGTHRRAAQRFGVATGHRNLRPLWTSHEPALHGAEWRLPGLLLPVRSRSARRRAVPEVRALPVDALVERLLLDALVPDQIAIAIAAMGQLEEESRQLERQSTLRRERARYEAERARRQYDAVEPEIVSSRARSSEPGRRSCVTSTLSRRSTRAGVRKNHSATVRQTAQSYRPWVRTCRGSGMPSPRLQPTASAFCALLCAKSCSIKGGRKVRSG